MKRNTKRRAVPAALVMLALVAAACSSDNKSSGSTATQPQGSTAETTAPSGSTGETMAPSDCTLDTPLKIGFAADLGDPAGASDQPGSEAAKVAVDLLNQAGGVGGKPVEYEVKDIQGDPAATQRAAQELLDDGVNAMIGPPFTSTGSPLLDTVDGKAPIIFMASTDSALADPSRGAFLASFSDQVQSSAIAQFALGKGYTSAITFSSTDDVYFSNNPAYFKDAFEHGGGKVLNDYAYSLNDSDFSTQVNDIANLPEKPQVLFTAMIMPLVQTLLEQLKNAGLGDIVVMGVDAFDATVVWSAGDVANGVYFSAHTFPQDTNDVQAFLDKAKAAGAKIETISFGALASDAVQVLAHAAETACSTDPAKLIDAINNIQDLKVTTGTVTYKGTNGVPNKDVVILTVKDGKPAFVEALRPDYVAG